MFLTMKLRPVREKTTISLILIEDDQSEIEHALQQLKMEGFLNDTQFAEWYCLQRQDYNPRSQRVLYMEMIMKGVSPEIVKQTIRDFHNEEECCKNIAMRKVGVMSSEKLTTYLLGKVLYAIMRYNVILLVGIPNRYNQASVENISRI